MASLQETKQRIISIKTTRKTTRAMQLVATVKLRHSMNNLENIQEYYSSVYETFQHLFSQTRDLASLFPQKPKAKTLFITITSNLGLCGAYISNVIKQLRTEYKTGDEIMILGTKGVSALNAHKLPIFSEITDIDDKPNYANASVLGLEAISYFLKGDVSEVKLIYTKFVNSITFDTTSIRLLPISPKDQMKETNFDDKAQAVTEFEPSPEVVIKESLKLYISSIIYGAMVESKTSEMASRRTAMENATENANELIEELNIKYNRARQSAITQEISEIISGSNTE